LGIYYGGHDEVSAFGETLANAMGGVADHIAERGRGKKPRWLKVPKLIFDVQRLNLTHAAANASRTFKSITDLTTKCGDFSAEEVERMAQWIKSHPHAVLVAHKRFNDLRAHVFCKGDEIPRREHFYRSGLVLAVTDGFKIQDQRSTVRDRRSDALTTLVARNYLANGDTKWSVFAKIRKPTQTDDAQV
jgi:hypothetical protein